VSSSCGGVSSKVQQSAAGSSSSNSHINNRPDGISCEVFVPGCSQQRRHSSGTCVSSSMASAHRCRKCRESQTDLPSLGSLLSPPPAAPAGGTQRQHQRPNDGNAQAHPSCSASQLRVIDAEPTRDQHHGRRALLLPPEGAALQCRSSSSDNNAPHLLPGNWGAHNDAPAALQHVLQSPRDPDRRREAGKWGRRRWADALATSDAGTDAAGGASASSSIGSSGVASTAQPLRQ
jgi:hypothetical protein